jgi:hypothetical protein
MAGTGGGLDGPDGVDVRGKARAVGESASARLLERARRSVLVSALPGSDGSGRSAVPLSSVEDSRRLRLRESCRVDHVAEELDAVEDPECRFVGPILAPARVSPLWLLCSASTHSLDMPLTLERSGPRGSCASPEIDTGPSRERRRTGASSVWTASGLADCPSKDNKEKRTAMHLYSGRGDSVCASSSSELSTLSPAHQKSRPAVSLRKMPMEDDFLKSRRAGEGGDALSGLPNVLTERFRRTSFESMVCVAGGARLGEASCSAGGR